jgi:hypothetical protein
MPLSGFRGRLAPSHPIKCPLALGLKGQAGLPALIPQTLTGPLLAPADDRTPGIGFPPQMLKPGDNCAT